MAVATTLPEVKPGAESRKQIEKLSGQKISTCYQCEKCTNGCPMTFAMDIMPHQVMHSLQLGLTDEITKSDTIWMCFLRPALLRCPNEIDILCYGFAMQILMKRALRLLTNKPQSFTQYLTAYEIRGCMKRPWP
jgi:heterodisulfide reductase subunit C/quinone-modifying oxidoreductase subunit QmoC